MENEKSVNNQSVNNQRVQTQKLKTTLKNGTVKIYTYVRPSKIKDKTKMLDLLKHDGNVIAILKNKSLKTPEKIDNIFNLTQTNPDYNQLKLSQIKNFVYRNI